MAYLNKVMIIGNLGADPEMRAMPDGVPMTTFRVACNRAGKDREGKNRMQTEWFGVVAWDKLAENCRKHLKKGASVLVEGRLRTRDWEDRDGHKRSRVEIVANNVQYLDRRVSETSEPAQADDAEEEVPF